MDINFVIGLALFVLGGIALFFAIFNFKVWNNSKHLDPTEISQRKSGIFADHGMTVKDGKIEPDQKVPTQIVKSLM